MLPEKLCWIFIRHEESESVCVYGPRSLPVVSQKVSHLLHDGYVELYAHSIIKECGWNGQNDEGQNMPPKSFFVLSGGMVEVNILPV
jgi:hypothetical protein